MSIDDNKEAVAMMKNTLGSLENRFREAYNKGYKDGLKDGASQVTAKLVAKILEEAEQTEPFITGTQIGEPKPMPKGVSTYASTEPQTCDDCIWTVCNYNKVFEDEQTEREGE